MSIAEVILEPPAAAPTTVGVNDVRPAPGRRAGDTQIEDRSFLIKIRPQHQQRCTFPYASQICPTAHTYGVGGFVFESRAKAYTVINIMGTDNFPE